MTVPEKALVFNEFQAVRRAGAKVSDVGQLLDMGFATRHVAQLLGVSVYKVRSWSRGELGWFQEAMNVAQLLAVTDFLRHVGAGDPAAWFETRLAEESGLTPLDLYRDDMLVFLGFLSGEMSAEKILDIHDAGWRRRGPSKGETFEGPDGDLVLRPRE